MLTGERAHYELAAGRIERAEELARAMQAFAGEGQLLPEQVWDADDRPERELFKGGATGSARPLVWAHAEYVKLRRSLQDGRVFDQPPQTVARYLKAQTPAAPFAVWRVNNKIRTMPAGKILRIETLARATVHWGVNAWADVQDVETVDTGLGVHVADLNTASQPAGSHVMFTLFWRDPGMWDHTDFRVDVEDPRHASLSS